MTNSSTSFLNDSESPFHSYEHDQDPIMIASRSEQLQKTRWRYCSESTLASKPMQRRHTNLQQPLNLVALGRTGDGKSSLLNDLLGANVFAQKISAKSQTKEIQSSQAFWAPLHPYMHGKETFGCQINVIDTPGFGDSQMRDQEFFNTIQQALLDTAIHKGGIHCILMVFKITANSDNVFKSIESFHKLVSPYTVNQDFWGNVLLVFTHVDIVNGNTNRYQSHKVALKTKVNRALKEKYGLASDLPMLWISTQKYTCGFLKGLSDVCDCEKGNRYHSDCRRRLYEQVMKRKNTPFTLKEKVEEEEEEGEGENVEQDAGKSPEGESS
ncbi:Peptidyl-prolyl cis-trans isomerase cyp10 [Mucor velutinosus]|uniref:Peptidyl-prolyl cis-trans isomerase cyp10 n=1 Tax=Mucor velutinosus TaxID=708070 RepID=A0AAN7DFB9_9FUNG|nr:Peptidyl-prolyl cis-trans isomerase cyp10 [Mucor velutinosus]